MRKTILILATAAVLAGCDRTQPAGRQTEDVDNKTSAADARQVNEMMAETKQEALESRVATLENQMDTLKAEVDTRADLGSALAPPPVPAAPAAPIVPPKLPYEPPSEH